jgi:hypothetical protein
MIEITKIVAPESGWPISMHCRHCRKTVIVLNIYAAQPKHGDYWLMEMCADQCRASVAELLATVPVAIELEADQWRQLAYRHIKEEAGK